MATIYIDDQPYTVKDGDNLLEACLGLGLDLPYFCWHPEMGSIGACRQCAVIQYMNEEDTRGKLVMGCMTPVAEGARFSLNAGSAQEFRENIVESLMINHPHDCPVCGEGGECHLQDMTVMVGHRDREYRGNKRTYRNQNLGPLINHEMNRCITCYRCVRFYQDYAGGVDLVAMASKNHVYFGRESDGKLDNEFSGNLVEVCPTGVFTDKPLVGDYTRKWDLQSAPSICHGCGVGCNISPGERYGRLKRVQNRFNREVNGYFLCDRGRFGGGYVNEETRPQYPGVRETDQFRPLTEQQALELISEWCRGNSRIAGIGSPRGSLETGFMLRQLVGDENFSAGLSADELLVLETIAASLSQCGASSGIVNPSIHQIEQADAVLILGEDVTHTAPRMALSIRQAARGIAVEMGAGLGLQPWQDAAIRNLAQDSRYPVFIAAPHATRLDDIAKETLRLNPGDIASLGEAIATRIQKGASADVFEGMLGAQAGRIAEKLAGAKRPLIVAGTAYSSVAIIQAAKAVAKSLAGDNCQPMLSFCLPEANSLGAALFDSAGQSLEDIHLRAIRGEIDTLVVVENDLHLRLSSEKVDQLFDSVERLIVLDCVDNPTISRADLALPSAAFTEAEGTLVNHEGRAQRFYPVINPLTNPASQRKPAWQWLSRIGNQLGYKQFSELMHFDQIEKACASANAKLKDIIRAAPDAAFRSHGEKIPRQPHRYSGRTAMNAGVSVHEPQQPSDQETPLAWSMEGAMPGDTPALLPYVWSPGWNSNQSLHRFQQEVGGPLRGGSAGVRLLDGCDSPVSDGGENSREETTFEENFIHRGDDFLMLPIYRIFGSEELSRRSPAIAKCCDYPFVALHPADAERLNVNEGDGVHVDTAVDAFEVRLDDSLVPGTVGYLAGQYQSAGLRAGSRRVISKAEQWQRRGMSTADLIASDGGGQ